MRFDEIDKNFKIETKLDLQDVVFYDPRCLPFSIYGVNYENGLYRRMPENIAASLNPNILYLSKNTAGGRIKFRTNSSYVAISTKVEPHHMTHMAAIGSHGFDLYVGKNERFFASFRPPFEMTDGFESVAKFESRRMREITINFPLYTHVEAVYIGLSENAKILPTEGYKYEQPIVFYGSSITQGGCASRPGNSYQGFISRALSTNYVNLGFSGNAKGEDIMAEYVAGLDMSVFVYDYDHNAPSLEHLEATHEKMFRTVREAQPTLPIVILSRPKYYLTDVEKTRLAIIKRTYDNAVARGDENVYFIPGTALMKFAREHGTVDGCHPTDLGFYSMVKTLIPVLKKILEKK